MTEYQGTQVQSRTPQHQAALCPKGQTKQREIHYTHLDGPHYPVSHIITPGRVSARLFPISNQNESHPHPSKATHTHTHSMA